MRHIDNLLGEDRPAPAFDNDETPVGLDARPQSVQGALCSRTCGTTDLTPPGSALKRPAVTPDEGLANVRLAETGDAT